MPDSYRAAISHADSLASGRPIVPSQEVPAAWIDPKDPHDQALIAEGKLLPIEEPGELSGEALDQRTQDLNIEGRSQMTADQKRKAIAKKEASQ